MTYLWKKNEAMFDQFKKIITTSFIISYILNWKSSFLLSYQELSNNCLSIQHFLSFSKKDRENLLVIFYKWKSHFTVNPRKHYVSVIISLNGGESKNAESAYEDGRLCEILAGYPTFDAAMNNQKTECYAAECPSESKISL